MDDDGLTVLFNGKTVAQKGSIPTLVMKGVEETNGSGARKLKVWLKEHYTGISEDRIRGGSRYIQTLPTPSGQIFEQAHPEANQGQRSTDQT